MRYCLLAVVVLFPALAFAQEATPVRTRWKSGKVEEWKK